MNTIINKIMNASLFTEQSFAGIEKYYSKNNNAFFFTLHYTIDEISVLKRYSEIAEKDSHKALLESFNNLIKEGGPNTLEKNSSLLILVKCTSLESIEKHHQQVLLLEEDEYYFKKYVILYTENTIAALNEQENLINYLTEKLNDEESFSKYAKNGFSEEIADYIMVMQLFIKLPFLKVQTVDNSFKALSEKITESLGETNERFVNWIFDNEERIKALDFMNENAEEMINELLSQLPNDQN